VINDQPNFVQYKLKLSLIDLDLGLLDCCLTDYGPPT